ncbi:unnamed protein product [Ectocarpus sp. 4 AP-2014]
MVSLCKQGLRLKSLRGNAMAMVGFAVYLGCCWTCVSVRAFLISNFRPPDPRGYAAFLQPGAWSSTARLLSSTTSAGDPSTGGSPTIADGDETSAPRSGVWHWRNGWEVHYERASSRRPAAGDRVREGGGQRQREGSTTPLLLLPGFGVGTFHFRRNMQELSETRDVYSIDFLGQGKSWPTRVPSREDGLCYSVDMWTEQVLAFINEVIGEPAYVAGNSLGGYIAANLAANYPRAVLGLALMNATPFWAFRKPSANAALNGGDVTDSYPPTDLSATRDVSTGSATSTGILTDSEIVLGNPATKGESPVEGSGDWLGWDGTLPAPAGLFRFGAWYFDRMRDPRTVRSMLGVVYSNPEAIGDEVVSEIIAATERGPSNHDYGVGGHEAFTSIVFSPKVPMSFEEMIDRIQVPMALIYGKEDPWVVPLWGHRIKRQRPETLYYEVSPSGHSPHHETPKTVNALLDDWLEYASAGGSPPLSRDGEVLEMQEETGTRVRATLVPDAKPRGPVEWLDTAVWSFTGGGDAKAKRP